MRQWRLWERRGRALEFGWRRSYVHVVATSSVSVPCPECGLPAAVTLTESGTDADVDEFHCPNKHSLSGEQAREIWAGAHQ
jgi:hypothetical protein